MAGLTCNIDRRGRIVRAVSGGVSLALGVAVLVLGVGLAGWLRWGGGVLLAALGAFQLFEAWKGWCAVRALGYRTPI